MTRFDLAKEAAFNLIDTLTEYDNATIINFNNEVDFRKAPVNHENPSVKKSYDCGTDEKPDKKCPTLEPIYQKNIQQIKRDLLRLNNKGDINFFRPIDQQLKASGGTEFRTVLN